MIKINDRGHLILNPCGQIGHESKHSEFQLPVIPMGVNVITCSYIYFYNESMFLLRKKSYSLFYSAKKITSKYFLG